MSSIDIVTWAFVRELARGDSIVVLAARPDLASFGDEEDALLEAQMFLSELLATADPDVVPRFALPPETRLHTTEVVIPRDDLGRRRNVTTPITIPSLVLPTLPNTKGRKDSWVMVLPLHHTFFVRFDEDLDEAIEAEVKRLVAAHELSPLEYLSLLPLHEERIARIEVPFQRLSGDALAKDRAKKKRLAERETKKNALDVLESIGEPLHAGLGARKGRLGPTPPLVLRDAELALLRAMLAGKERTSALVLGRERVGKSSLVRAWLEIEMEMNRPRFVFATSGARLIAGMSGFGQWQERVRRVMAAAELLDAVLYFEDLADLFADRQSGHIDIPSAIRPWLEEGRVRVIGEVREDVLDRIEDHNAGFFSCFGRLRMAPFDAPTTLAVLEELRAHREKTDRDRLVLLPEANATLIELAERYLPYEAFPGKAIQLAADIEQAREIALGSEARGAKIGRDAVYEAFSLRTGVPLLLLRDDRALELHAVEEALRRRVIGQDDAVRRVAELVCVIKAGLQPSNKPLATLLFVGPTGVGKTELTRALATLLFGSEERLARFDMSEYATAYATERLFRGVDGGEGLLTRKVREQPFSVVLLDEIEKAHPAAFDLLLQVAGDGRLTDGRGKTAYFQNTILIMTSNLGASHRARQTGFSRDEPAARRDREDAHYAKVVSETFRPEMVNRIDRVVVFRSLEPHDVREVTRVSTARAFERRGIRARSLDVSITDDALDHLAAGGLSDAYGARALRRHVEREVVTPISQILSCRAADDGSRVAIARADELAGPGEELGASHGGLRFGVVRGAARRTHSAAWTLERITAIRREVHRQLRLDRIVELKDQIDFLVAQLGYGLYRSKKALPARDGQELAQMNADQARYAALYERLSGPFHDIAALEELALIGLTSGEDTSTLRQDAERAREKFREALAFALVAQEKRKNTVTLMCKELDSKRALDRWLLPLLDDVGRRGWTALAHLDGDKDPPSQGTWPAGRRFGPPRSVDEARGRVEAPDRTFRNVILRVEGDHAGVWLALERGLHRFAGFTAGDPAHLDITLVAARATLTDAEWIEPDLEPPNAQAAEALSRQAPARAVRADVDEVLLVGGARTVEIAFADYWPKFEQIALEHLLLFDEVTALDWEEQLRPIFDDPFHEVRVLVRAGQKLGAIKKYRELTNSSLVDAKNFVEAMDPNAR